MMRVEMTDAAASLSAYARKAQKEPVVLTRRGKPIAALMPLDRNGWEDLTRQQPPHVPAHHPALSGTL